MPPKETPLRKNNMKLKEITFFKESVFIPAIGTNYFKQDDDGHWYWIPSELVASFEEKLDKTIGLDYMDDPDIFDDFIDTFEEYRTLGDKKLVPHIYKVFFENNN